MLGGMSAHQPITVVGAGLGGLTFAAVLHRHGVPVTVVDLDASPTARAQGGMLDIHEDSGQAALRAAGLYEEFRRIIHPGGDATRVFDKTGRLRHADDGNDRKRPEVNRRELRNLLLSQLPATTVHWRAKVTEVSGGEVMLQDGKSFTTDLLIGADGAWSRVRPLVSQETPVYTGLSFVEMRLTNADERHPRSAALVGGGLMFALAEGRGFLAHRDPDGSLHVYAALEKPADWANEADKATLMDEFADWDAGLRNLIADTDGPLVPRAVHALPIGHRWDRVPGVTLVGDAAHLMSPFAGEGANLAMQDGAELAQALLANPDDREEALKQYEERLFPRSEAAAKESAASMEMCFGKDTPQGLVDMFNQVLN
jgi:2-polyprenyl-6-methoxyphenol hydroxylase-like FAD-dependent oxidoreductase